jgi:hypothetical protein
LGVLPGEPIGKHRAAPDSDSLKHGFCADPENTFRHAFAGQIRARQILPERGNFCRVGTAIISALTKRYRAFVGKIWVKERAYEIVAQAAHKKRAALSRRSPTTQ